MIGMESTWSKFSKLVDEFNNKENVVEKQQLLKKIKPLKNMASKT